MYYISHRNRSFSADIPGVREHDWPLAGEGHQEGVLRRRDGRSYRHLQVCHKQGRILCLAFAQVDGRNRYQ